MLPSYKALNSKYSLDHRLRRPRYSVPDELPRILAVFGLLAVVAQRRTSIQYAGTLNGAHLAYVCVHPLLELRWDAAGMLTPTRIVDWGI